MRILFVTPEAIPFAKTGGLADVAGALPAALRGLGVDARLIMPFYRAAQDRNFPLNVMVSGLYVPLGRQMLRADILQGATPDRVPVYFVAREDLYDRPNLYGNAWGDYYDNGERFIFFSRAVVTFIEQMTVRPHCIHCNEWQTGLIPAWIKANPDRFKGIRTVFTVHNVGYQGIYPWNKFELTGLPEHYFHPEGMEYWGNFSLLKAGIVFADALTTVSPTHAKEIQTPEFGKGLDGLLRHRRNALTGILNGIDENVWNPGSDPLLPANYTFKKISGKHVCKRSLIHELGMDDAFIHRPVLAVISRLDAQKGIDLLLSSLDHIMTLDVGLIVLGTGEASIQNAICDAIRKYPHQIRFEMRFDEPLAHRILGGADMVLVPSRYEPCGLIQMYAMKYGTIPIVHGVGGLEDTVMNFDPKNGKGNGFKFTPDMPHALIRAVREAVSLYQNQNAWRRLMQNAMQADFSWTRSARNYLKLYGAVVGNKG